MITKEALAGLGFNLNNEFVRHITGQADIFLEVSFRGDDFTVLMMTADEGIPLPHVRTIEQLKALWVLLTGENIDREATPL